MAIAVHIVNTPLPDASGSYAEGWRLLEERGLEAPDGRLSHTGFLIGDVVHVFDVWESEEHMAAFMQDMRPVLDQVGMQIAAAPEVGEVLRREEAQHAPTV